MNDQLQNDIDQLNSFLRGEHSAVETYDQVITKVKDQALLRTLRDGRASHARRVELLKDYIRGHGGEPATGSGAWGALAKTLEGGAKVFGVPAAISVLEEGEDHGLNDYQRDLPELSPEGRLFVMDRLLPEQQRSHDMLGALKANL